MAEQSDEQNGLGKSAGQASEEEEESKKDEDGAEDSSDILNDIDSFCEEPDISAGEEVKKIKESPSKVPGKSEVASCDDETKNAQEDIHSASDPEDLNLDLLDEKDDSDEENLDAADLSSLDMDELLSMMTGIVSNADHEFDPKEVTRRVRFNEEAFPKVLKEVYKMYKNFSDQDAWKEPPRVRPRNFWEKGKENKFGFETLEEFIDNNHPLWLRDRQFCHDFLTYGPDYTECSMADYVNSKWGIQHIDVSENLSVINEVSHQNSNQQARRPSLLDIHHLKGPLDCRAKVLSDFCKLDFEAVKKRVLERERKRLVTYKAYSDGSNSNNNIESFTAKVHEEQFTEEEVKKILMAKGQEEGRGMKRTVDAVFGVEEVFNMKRHYQRTGAGEATIPRSHVDEILCMEAAVDKFDELYKDEDSDPEDGDEDSPLRPDEY